MRNLKHPKKLTALAYAIIYIGFLIYGITNQEWQGRGGSIVSLGNSPAQFWGSMIIATIVAGFAVAYLVLGNPKDRDRKQYNKKKIRTNPTMRRILMLLIAIADFALLLFLSFIFGWKPIVLIVSLTSGIGFFAASWLGARRAGLDMPRASSWSKAHLPSAMRFNQTPIQKNTDITPSQLASLMVGIYTSILFLIPGPFTNIVAAAILLGPGIWDFLVRRMQRSIEMA